MTTRRDIEISARTATSGSPGRKVIAAVGIDRYQHWQRLANAVRDATRTAELFGQLGFEQITAPLLDHDATGKAIQSLVTNDLKKLGPDDSLVLFYAGHGATYGHRPGGEEIKTGYLIPADASNSSDDVSTWINLEGWLRAVALLPAKHILVILDACRSGIALDGIIQRNRGDTSWHHETSTALQARRSRRIITSALGDQVALDSGPKHGHSLFTGCLLEGLTYDLRRRGDQATTGSGLGMYLQRRVDTYTRSQQTPDFGYFYHDDRGELAIPLVGSGTARPPTNTVAAAIVELAAQKASKPARVRAPDLARTDRDENRAEVSRRLDRSEQEMRVELQEARISGDTSVLSPPQLRREHPMPEPQRQHPIPVLPLSALSPNKAVEVAPPQGQTQHTSADPAAIRSELVPLNVEQLSHLVKRLEHAVAMKGQRMTVGATLIFFVSSIATALLKDTRHEVISLLVANIGFLVALALVALRVITPIGMHRVIHAVRDTPERIVLLRRHAVKAIMWLQPIPMATGLAFVVTLILATWLSGPFLIGLLAILALVVLRMVPVSMKLIIEAVRDVSERPARQSTVKSRIEIKTSNHRLILNTTKNVDALFGALMRRCPTAKIENR